MQDFPSISKKNPEFPEHLNFQTLRELGIDHLQKLSGKLWTDYNLHDPGVTILEVLCYAITDLGYRTNLDIRDLLAQKPQASKVPDDNFFTPNQILTCNPVTELDFRKLLMNIDGISNAWVQKSSVLGLYTVFLDIDLDPIQINNRKPQLFRFNSYKVPKKQRDIIDQEELIKIIVQVKEVLHSHRNLCEDFDKIMIFGKKKIKLEAEIEIAVDAVPEDVKTTIYTKIQEYLSPQLNFYSLQELLDKGRNILDIFSGRPAVIQNSNPSHGFLDPEELKAHEVIRKIYTSDLYELIFADPRVININQLSITKESEKNEVTNFPRELTLKGLYLPVFDAANSKIFFRKNGVPIATQKTDSYLEYQAKPLKSPRSLQELDLSVPQGSYSDLADYYSIHYDFPMVYGIGEEGLPEQKEEKRSTQAKQLKGYLVFFDQILANYLAQLAQIRNLFSWNTDNNEKYPQTYFSQDLNFPGVEEIIRNHPTYQTFLDDISTTSEINLERRSRFLDHLLARFAESFTDYVLLNYQILTDDRDKNEITKQMNGAKAQFLQNYPQLSSDRFRAFNYLKGVEEHNLSGFQNRVSSLLGFNDISLSKKINYEIPEYHDKYKFLLFDKNNKNQLKAPLLSSKKFNSRDDALKAGETLLELASDRNNYDLSGNNRYKWEILDDKKPIAKKYYKSKDERDQAIQTIQNSINIEGFYVLEHILLSPRHTEDEKLPSKQDPYSFWVSIILPAWPKRFRNINFRRWVEKTLRLEAPAHIALKIGWLDLPQMDKFETAYFEWLDHLHKYANNEGNHLTDKLNYLIKVLEDLINVYPQTNLISEDENIVTDNSLVLDQSSLGTIYPYPKSKEN